MTIRDLMCRLMDFDPDETVMIIDPNFDAYVPVSSVDILPGRNAVLIQAEEQ